MMMYNFPYSLAWETIDREKIGQAGCSCDNREFYLEIPGIVRFLALPDTNSIIIEKAQDDIPFEVISTWLMGTVMAYLLQYHGYLVLHGSAVLMDQKAVIFSGQSGAGKSTMASAFVKKGYALMTDDLLVITKNNHGQYCLVPGPPKLKLWEDSMLHFNHDIHDAVPVMLKINKYAVPVENIAHQMFPVSAFYELNIGDDVFHGHQLNKMDSLKTLMRNVYRYFMLKPLGQLQAFFEDCQGLSDQIVVHKLNRTTSFDQLSQLLDYIELNQGVKECIV